MEEDFIQMVVPEWNVLQLFTFYFYSQNNHLVLTKKFVTFFSSYIVTHDNFSSMIKAIEPNALNV